MREWVRGKEAERRANEEFFLSREDEGKKRRARKNEKDLCSCWRHIFKGRKSFSSTLMVRDTDWEMAKIRGEKISEMLLCKGVLYTHNNTWEVWGMKEDILCSKFFFMYTMSLRSFKLFNFKNKNRNEKKFQFICVYDVNKIP